MSFENEQPTETPTTPIKEATKIPFKFNNKNPDTSGCICTTLKTGNALNILPSSQQGFTTSIGNGWTLKYIEGDLVKAAWKGEVDVLVHGCNCFNTMGKGIALQIKNTFPEAYAVDTSTEKGSEKKLGSLTYAKIGNVCVVNAYTQYDYHAGPKGRSHIDYNALAHCMRLIKENYSGKRIGMPKIGAGLAGGFWPRIEQIIIEELSGEDVTIYTFSEPNKQ